MLHLMCQVTSNCMRAHILLQLIHQSAPFLPPSGGLVKEAAEDLEWTSGDITVHVQRHPQQITLSAQGNGEMEVGRTSCC